MPKHNAAPDPVPHAVPPDAGGDDALYAQYVRDKIQDGLDSLDQGGGIPHDAARRRMGKWLDEAHLKVCYITDPGSPATSS